MIVHERLEKFITLLLKMHLYQSVVLVEINYVDLLTCSKMRECCNGVRPTRLALRNESRPSVVHQFHLPRSWFPFSPHMY